MNQVWWIMVLVYGVAALTWWGFIQQIILGQPWGSNPASDWMMWLIWLAIGIGLPVFFNWIELAVEVSQDGVRIRYLPFTNRLIPLSNIISLEVRTYKPIREYGGWGIRGFSSSRKIAYNVKGNRGVELTLHDGRLVMIGSQRSEELAQAITEGMQRIGLK